MKFDRINSRQGLSQDGIDAIVQDRQGFLWFASRDGLNRYDGQRFKIYQREYGNPNTLPENQLTHLALDSQGNMWIATTDAGVAVLDPKTDQIRRYPYGDEPGSLDHAWAYKLLVDRDDRVWVATQAGLNLLDEQRKSFTQIALKSKEGKPLEYGVYALLEDPVRDIIWIGTYEGLIGYHKNSGTFEYFVTEENNEHSLHGSEIYALWHDSSQQRIWISTYAGTSYMDSATSVITRIDLTDEEDKEQPVVSCGLVDRRGLVWMGTGNGLVVYDPESKAHIHHRHAPNDDRSISGNIIDSIFEDDSGLIWLGTFTSGINRYDGSSETMAHLKRFPALDPGFNGNSTFSFFEDKDGQIWIGGYYDGVSRFDRSTREMVHFKSDYEDPTKLSNGRVWGMAGSGDGFLWLATGYGLDQIEIATGKIDRYIYHPDDAKYYDHNYNNDISLDTQGRLWLATDAGLALFDRDSASWTFTEHKANSSDHLSGQMVNIVVSARSGLLWLGMKGEGISMLNPRTMKFRHYSPDPEDFSALSHGYTLCILEDQKSDIWVGTLGGGLNRLNSDGTFTRITRGDGLLNEKVFALTEDQAGYLWLGTNKGISRVDPATFEIKNFDLSYNIQANEFDKNAGFTSRDGTVFLGGLNGFNMFHPSDIKDSLYQPNVVITGLKIRNEPVKLARDISLMDHLNMAHDDRSITFQFASMDYKNPERCSFAYQLQGLGNEWIDMGRKNELYLPSLSPGDYTLKVKGTNHEGLWSDKQASLSISVPAPWWRTRLAYTIYTLLLAGLILTIIAGQRRKLERERRVNEQLRQVDHLKDEFLANTSHELRTPLHGMVGLAESLLAGAAGDVNKEMRHNLDLMITSGKRLENLVNDILDFSKIRQRSLELAIQPLDLCCLTQIVLTICDPLAKDKNLQLLNTVPADFPRVLADENRLQQILYNLIGNAIKFTDAGGVQVMAATNGRFAEISVVDTGIGFDQKHSEKLFESFQQADGSIARRFGGTGLGLAITRELVSLHGGAISATASPGRGSHFTFSIPLVDESQVVAAAEILLQPQEITQQPVAQEESPRITSITPQGSSVARRFRILAVDDEPANRQILANFLSLQNYEISLASNGEEALALLEANTYDLLLLDVMMPRLSGFEVCRKIRQHIPLQELPIIFLTAKSQTKDMVMGFEMGANDYLSKPFTKDALLSRVRPHLELLDINRNLEDKVRERTTALRDYANELETIDSIVRTINRELEPEGLFPTILKQGVALFQDAICGTILVRNPKTTRYETILPTPCSDLCSAPYSEDEVRQRFLSSRAVFTEHLYTQPVTEVFRNAPAEYSDQWVLTMTFIIDQRLEGFMLLLTRENPRNLPPTEISRLQRYREHALSALARARMLQNLTENQRDLVEAAHFIGMAENARMVLHNMGNSLNSINTSCDVLEQALLPERWVGLADKLSERLNSELDLATFFTSDPQGQRFPSVLNELFSRLKRRDAALGRELQRLHIHLGDALRVLRDQNEFTNARETPEMIDPNQLIQACIIAQNFARDGIDVQFDFAPLPPLLLPKIKFMHLLTCLCKNARKSIIRLAPSRGQIRILTSLGEDHIRIQVSDNGDGVAPDETAHIFSQGHTASTPELHTSANVTKELGGKIRLESRGLGHGQTIELILPMHSKELNSENIEAPL